jgi:hypothetical protein
MAHINIHFDPPTDAYCPQARLGSSFEYGEDPFLTSVSTIAEMDVRKTSQVVNVPAKRPMERSISRQSKRTRASAPNVDPVQRPLSTLSGVGIRCSDNSLQSKVRVHAGRRSVGRTPRRNTFGCRNVGRLFRTAVELRATISQALFVQRETPQPSADGVRA